MPNELPPGYDVIARHERRLPPRLSLLMVRRTSASRSVQSQRSTQS